MIYNDLFSSAKLKHILNQYHILPKKSLGQNFLIDRNIVEKIMQVVGGEPYDTLLEIGAGLGVLTVPLAEMCRHLIAYEIDQRLILPLTEITRDYPNIEIRNEDVLKAQSVTRKAQSYGVVGNLPYYLTSRLLKTFLSAEHKPERIVVMIQKEVGERICAKPPNMSLLAVSVQFYGTPRIRGTVSCNSFFPPPAVDSVILEITNHEPLFTMEEEEFFFSLVKAGFAKRRKFLISNLSGAGRATRDQWEHIFNDFGLDKRIRAEALSIKEWHEIFLRLRAL